MAKSKYGMDDHPVQDMNPGKPEHNRTIIKPLAINLYNDIWKSVHSINPVQTENKNYKVPGKNEKSLWHEYASGIEDKYKSLNLLIRPFEDFCRTCIITEKEIIALSKKDQHFFQSHKFDQISIAGLEEFCIQLNYLVPSVLKKMGYEVIRYEEESEISFLTIKKLARAIHSKYKHEIKSQTTKSTGNTFYADASTGNLHLTEFDDLPDEIKLSNIDNAVHIPTKLLSIGYKIREVTKGYKPFALKLNDEEIETMAMIEHVRWSWEKRLNGWTFGRIRDEEKKFHPSLVPYEELSESEKEKDRQLVRLIPAFLQDLNFEAYPLSPNRIKKLSYAIKPQSSIHKILDETRELNDQIRKLVSLSPAIEDMVRIRNNKIEEAIIEVEGSYNYAKYIQEAFLPDDLFIRECFTDSFILYKPKDIVSGDFYFFSKQKDQIIFALADCTGHGIPGALLSTIGYGILDQAVNEKGLRDTSLILHHLYSRIHKFLRKDSDENGISDDMDILVCILDNGTNILKFSGVRSRFYRVTGGKLTEYRAHSRDENFSDSDERSYTSAAIQLNSSDAIYLSSDGYADQFGGKNHKRFKKEKLKKLLESIQDLTMPEQADKLYEETEQWREENNEDQTDDILVLGIRI
jgi:serine phosphatase RsbU (regulator of sigma subunit)